MRWLLVLLTAQRRRSMLLINQVCPAQYIFCDRMPGRWVGRNHVQSPPCVTVGTTRLNHCWFVGTIYFITGKWCMWDENCEKDHFDWDYELAHCTDEPYVHLYRQLRPSSFLGNAHGDDFWDPQHAQKLAVGQLTAAIGHLVIRKFPHVFPAMQTILRGAHPGVATPCGPCDSRLHRRFSLWVCAVNNSPLQTGILEIGSCQNLGLLIRGMIFCKGRTICRTMSASCRRCSGVTLQHAAGDIRVGMPVNCRGFCLRSIFITDLYVGPVIY